MMSYFDIAKDVLLISLCAACAIYCWLLSRRLKKLNNLETGVGASILSLTKVIEETHSASQLSRREIENALKDMQNLISEAERANARMEARLTDLGRGAEEAGRMANRLRTLVDVDTQTAIDAATTALTDLNRISRIINERRKKAA